MSTPRQNLLTKDTSCNGVLFGAIGTGHLVGQRSRIARMAVRNSTTTRGKVSFLGGENVDLDPAESGISIMSLVDCVQLATSAPTSKQESLTFRKGDTVARASPRAQKPRFGMTWAQHGEGNEVVMKRRAL